MAQVMRASSDRYRPRPSSALQIGIASALLVALMTMTGCGSGSGASGMPSMPDDNGGEAGGGSGGGSGNGAGAGSTLEPTFESIQQNVFTPICTACHTGASAPQGLRLDEGNSYGLLVGVPSTEQPEILRVAPGDPDASYLIHKLEGTAAVGERMPLGGPPLPQADIAMIRQWILDGAQQAQPPAPSAPIRLTSLTPEPDATLPELPTMIIAQFDRELDATSVTPETFTLMRSGGDGVFDDGNDVVIEPASVSVSPSNPMAAVFDLSGAPPVEDTYRVRLAGAGATTVLDIDANALDGEFAGTLPSGDGAQGGDFIALFVVEGVQPTLESIQAHVFTPICSACHTGPSSDVLPAGMDLSTADASFMSLVAAPSLQDPSLLRVEPGNSEASYLVQKIEGTAAQGAQMPLNLPPLDEQTLAAVRAWIDSGAAR